MIEGKTIARVIEDVDSPWLVFTDGTGIRISGYEGADYTEVDAEEIAGHEAAIDADRRAAHEARAYQQSWMMRSCEERGGIRSDWLRERLGDTVVFPYWLEDQMIDDMVWDLNHSLIGGPSKPPKARCPVCNERSCPNAPDMKAPNRGLVYQTGTITIPKLSGS